MRDKTTILMFSRGKWGAGINTSSAADLANLAAIALQDPIFADIVRIQRYTLPASATHRQYTWETTNSLLELYPGTDGVKTGFSEEAGYCLIFAASREKHALIGIILHDTDDNAAQRFTDARTLLEWGFHLPLLPPQ